MSAGASTSARKSARAEARSSASPAGWRSARTQLTDGGSGTRTGTGVGSDATLGRHGYSATEPVSVAGGWRRGGCFRLRRGSFRGRRAPRFGFFIADPLPRLAPPTTHPRATTRPGRRRHAKPWGKLTARRSSRFLPVEDAVGGRGFEHLVADLRRPSGVPSFPLGVRHFLTVCDSFGRRRRTRRRAVGWRPGNVRTRARRVLRSDGPYRRPPTRSRSVRSSRRS